VCFNEEEQLLNDVGVLKDDIFGAPLTAEQLLKTEAFVTSERLSRSGVEYIERKKSMGFGPPGTGDVAQLSRVVQVPGNANCDGIKFLKPLEPEESMQLMADLPHSLREMTTGLFMAPTLPVSFNQRESADCETPTSNDNGSCAHCSWTHHPAHHSLSERSALLTSH
jgi:hypothetical protein